MVDWHRWGVKDAMRWDGMGCDRGDNENIFKIQSNVVHSSKAKRVSVRACVCVCVELGQVKQICTWSIYKSIFANTSSVHTSTCTRTQHPKIIEGNFSEVNEEIVRSKTVARERLSDAHEWAKATSKTQDHAIDTLATLAPSSTHSHYAKRTARQHFEWGN